MSRFGIFKNGVRHQTKSGARFNTAAQAWGAVRVALNVPPGTPTWEITGITVKRLADRLWYVSVDHTCTLVRARDEDDARVRVRKEVGSRSTISGIRVATKDDIAWFEAMGGKKQ